MSLVPLLEGWSGSEPVALFWHFPHYHGSGSVPPGAIRVGAFKLVEWFAHDRVELYDLAEDVGEREDLAAAMPEKAEELKASPVEWRRRVGAAMPSPESRVDGRRLWLRGSFWRFRGSFAMSSVFAC